MRKSKEAKFYKRMFLNEDGGRAFLELKVEEARFTEHGSDLNVTFGIGDCSRQVDIDFEAYTSKEYGDGQEVIDRARAKFRRFQSAIKAFGVAFNEELDPHGKEAVTWTQWM